jgi:hypothetical protein
VRRIRLRCLVSGLLMAVAAHALAAPVERVDEAQRQQMTEYLVDMLPVHRIFEELLILKAPEIREGLDEPQVACMAERLSRPAFVVRKRQQVDAYADEAPQEFVGALALLESGAADVLKRLGLSSISSSLASDDAEAGAVAAQFNILSEPPDQVVAFMTFAYGSPYQRLRQLSGYGDFTGAASAAPTPAEQQIDAMAAEIAGACAIPEKFFE